MKKFLSFSLMLLSALLISQLFTPLATDVSAQGWTQGQQEVSTGQTGLPDTTVKDVILNILKWLLSLVFVLTVLAFVGSGVIFIMSFGNSGLTEMAKNWLTFAIIGLIVSVLGFVIVLAISGMLTGNIQNTRGGGSSGGGFWANLWGEDNNGNGVNINTGPDGTTIDGRLGDFEFNGIPLPTTTPGSTPPLADPWVNPDDNTTFGN